MSAEAIRDGDTLPPFPFKVVCLNNTGRELVIEIGKTYTVLEHCDTERTNIAGADFRLKEVNTSLAIWRFSIVKEALDTDRWEAWRDHGKKPDECVCRILRTMCEYHR